MIAKAYSHPLRIEILGLLENRVASPRQLATELDAGLSLTSYHVRQLAKLKLIKLVRRKQVRGAIEHYYTATVRPTITDAGWARVPQIVKRAYLGGKIAQMGKEIVAAAERGGFDHADMHLTRTSLRLSPDAWREAAQIMARALEDLDALREETGEEPADGSPERHATAVLMLFEAATPAALDAHAPLPSEVDECEDIAPPA